MSENIGRRKIFEILGGATAAGLLGEKAAEAKELDVEDIRKEMRQVLTEVIPIFRTFIETHSIHGQSSDPEMRPLLTDLKLLCGAAERALPRNTKTGEMEDYSSSSALRFLAAIFSEDPDSSLPKNVWRNTRNVLDYIEVQSRRMNTIVKSPETKRLQNDIKERLDKTRSLINFKEPK